MAALHSALKSLSPTTFSSIPTSPDELDHYLSTIFSDCQVILESVPIADPSEDSHHARSRSTTNASSTSHASSASEMSASSARSPEPASELKELQKEWGKAIKLSAKENPLGVSVHKTSGKDGKGAWFARRSVHEGLGFSRFKKGLQREFPESLETGHGKPGEGNIRGIGGERKVEDIGVKGRGRVQVWQLSAQFPGPTTPRDFITLLITSSRAMHEYGAKHGKEDVPEIEARHYMIISRPCDHPETKPRSGYIRGQYESVEFIREIIRKPAGGSAGATSNNVLHHAHSTEEIPELGHLHAPGSADPHADDHRKRSTTFGTTQEIRQANDAHHEHYDPEENPIEWIMITRSDPGGSVPRFMVERGTPASIVADASKFLDWACQKDDVHDEPPTPSSEQPPSLTQRPRLDSFSSWQANGTLAGVHETHTRDSSNSKEEFPAIDEQSEESTVKEPDSPTVSMKSEPAPTHTHNEEHHAGMFEAASGAFAAAVGAYAPKVVLDHLPPGLGTPKANASSPALLSHNENSTLSTSSTLATHHEDDHLKVVDDDAMSDMSSLSFRSAESHRTISSHSPDNQSKNESTLSISSPARSKDQTDISSTSLTKSNDKSSADIAKEHQTFTKRRATLDSKLADVRKKYQPAEPNQPLSESQQDKIRKAEEKHKKQLAKEEENHKKNLSKLEERREKELKKQEEKEKREKEKAAEKEKQEQDKQRQEKEKDELTKTKRERDEAVEKSKVLERQVEMLSKQVGDLQRENTGLKAMMAGKAEPVATAAGSGPMSASQRDGAMSPPPGGNERSREILRVIDEEQSRDHARSRSNSGLRRIREMVASSG